MALKSRRPNSIKIKIMLNVKVRMTLYFEELLSKPLEIQHSVTEKSNYGLNEIS